MKKIISFSLILLVIDQLVKLFIVNTINLNQTLMAIPNFLYFTYIKNTGAAWSILQNNTTILIVLGVIAILLLMYLIKKENPTTVYKICSYSLLIGGILGNLVDRIHYGSVVDYIFVNFLDMPIFNLSDMFIIAGVILIVYEILRGDKDAKLSSN